MVGPQPPSPVCPLVGLLLLDILLLLCPGSPVSRFPDPTFYTHIPPFGTFLFCYWRQHEFPGGRLARRSVLVAETLPPSHTVIYPSIPISQEEWAPPIVTPFDIPTPICCSPLPFIYSCPMTVDYSCGVPAQPITRLGFPHTFPMTVHLIPMWKGPPPPSPFPWCAQIVGGLPI